MATNVVDLGIQYFPQFANGNPIAGAQIFIGLPDLDPQIPANQVQVYVEQEDGTQVAVSQPVRTGAGGVPTYNGSPVTIKVATKPYSAKVLNSFGAQIYYKPNVTNDTEFVWASDYGKSGGNTIENLVGISGVITRSIYEVVGFYNLTLVETQYGGNRRFLWNPDKPKSAHNGVTIISPTVLGNDLQDTQGLLDFFDGEGETEPGGNGCWVADDDSVLYVTWAGADPYGVFNSTPAMNAISRIINAKDGGVVDFPYGTNYQFGFQPFVSGVGYTYYEQLAFRDCTNPIYVRGNGAQGKYIDGFKFGTFNKITGLPKIVTLPYFDISEIADPGQFIVAHRNKAVIIDGLYIAGNIQNCVVGGQWGDAAGWQLGHGFLNAYDNEYLCLTNFDASYYGVDGILTGFNTLTANDPRMYPVIIKGGKANFCGRQGWSAGGGNWTHIEDVEFFGTGKNGLIQSTPSAGIDFEPITFNKNVTLVRVKIANCFGAGILSFFGDANSDISIIDSVIVGTTSTPLFLEAQNVQLYNTTVIGAITRLGSQLGIPEKAGQVYGGKLSMVQADYNSAPTTADQLIYGAGVGYSDLTQNPYLTFDGTRFTADSNHRLPFSVLESALNLENGVRYRDVFATQASSADCLMNGLWTGDNRLNPGGAWVAANSRVRGTLKLNGVKQNSEVVDNLEKNQTFTPVLKFGGSTSGFTLYAQAGKVTKMADLAFFDITIGLNSLTTASGAATIELPFSAAGSSFNPPVSQGYVAGLNPASGVVVSSHFIIGATNVITLGKVNSSGTFTALTHADFTSTTTISLQGVVRI